MERLRAGAAPAYHGYGLYSWKRDPSSRPCARVGLAASALVFLTGIAHGEEPPTAISEQPPTAIREEPPSTNAECAGAYEHAQVSRQSGQLLAARASLQSCARDACPDFIRADCATWYGEIQHEVPTVVFSAKSRGRDLIDVQISLEGRSLASRIDGQALELDPGEYRFSFAAPGMQSKSQRAVIVRGQRNRMIQVELVPVEAPMQGPNSAAQRAHSVPRSLLVPGIFTGIGAAGLAGFAVLGSAGRSEESRLKGSCSPACSDQQISDARTKYLTADVSLGLGVASLALGAYFFFSQASSDPNAGAPVLNVRASAEQGSLQYGGTF